MVLVTDLIGSLDSLQTFYLLAGIAHIHVNDLSSVQNEAITFVHGRHVKRDLQELPLIFWFFNPMVLTMQIYLSDANISFALNLQKLLFHLIGINVLKTAGNSAVEITYTFIS